ncbi:MAG: hypothetical protein AB7U63_10935 [Porticoccaceae bacterium]
MHPTTLTLHIHRNMAEDGATLIDLGGCLVRLYEDKWTALDRHGRFIFTDKEVAQLTRMLADVSASAALLRKKGRC